MTRHVIVQSSDAGAIAAPSVASWNPKPCAMNAEEGRTPTTASVTPFPTHAATPRNAAHTRRPDS